MTSAWDRMSEEHKLAFLWRHVIGREMEAYEDSWGNVVQCNMTEAELDTSMVDGRPIPEEWTIWTAERVYFPTCYDSSFGVASAPRNPCDERMAPVG